MKHESVPSTVQVLGPLRSTDSRVNLNSLTFKFLERFDSQPFFIRPCQRFPKPISFSPGFFNSTVFLKLKAINSALLGFSCQPNTAGFSCNLANNFFGFSISFEIRATSPATLRSVKIVDPTLLLFCGII